MSISVKERRALRARRVRRCRRVAGLVLASIVGAILFALVGNTGGRHLASATTTVPTTTTVPEKPRPKIPFTFVAGGDIALNGEGANSATFAGIRQYLHGDLVFGNQEGVLADGGTPKCAPYGVNSCYTFRGLPSSASGLAAAGFTAMSVANNHALDYGADAQRQTIAALSRAGIDHVGLPGEITVVRAGKVKVALVACAPYPWAQSLLDIPGSAALVRKAATRADIVLVYMHAGAEGSSASHVPYGEENAFGEDRGNPRAFTHAMIDAGAALVFGSGPHTLRGLEWYRGHLIVYSLGNLAGNNTLSTSGWLSTTALLSLRLRSDGVFLSGKLIPLRLSTPGTPSPDPYETAITMIRSLSQADFGASAPSIASDGTIAVP